MIGMPLVFHFKQNKRNMILEIKNMKLAVGYALAIVIGASTLTACGGSGGSSKAKATTDGGSKNPDVSVPDTATPAPETVEGNAAPLLNSLSVIDADAGKTLAYDTLTASYSFSDNEGDAEGETIVTWYRDGVVIDSANALSYKLQELDTGKGIHVSIQPVALTGTPLGNTYSSSVFTPLDKRILPLRALSESSTNTSIGLLTEDGAMNVVSSYELGHVYTATKFNGKSLIWSSSPTYGIEPWVSNGFENETVLLKDTAVGTLDGGLPASQFKVSGDFAYFSSANRIWVTDGTPGGTAELMPEGEYLGAANLLVAAGGLIFSTYENNAGGKQISTMWHTDGTVDGTVEIQLEEDFTVLQVINTRDKTLVLATNSARVDFTLYELNLENTIATKIKDLPTGLMNKPTPYDIYPDVFHYETDSAFCISYLERRFIALNTMPSSNPSLPEEIQYYPALSQAVNYCTNDSIADLELLELDDSSITDPYIIGTSVDDDFYMTGKKDGSQIDNVLLKTDLAGIGINELLEQNFNSLLMTGNKINGKDVFILDSSVWVTGGSSESTTSLGVKAWSSVFTEVNGQLLFPNRDTDENPGIYSQAFYLTDGTPEGTEEIANYSGAKGNALPGFALGDKAYFFMGGVDETDGFEYSLFESDGTEVGTKLMVRDESSFVYRFSK